MITGNMYEQYFQTVLKILPMYSHDTTRKLIGFMSSDEAVLKVEQILSTNPTEDELLEKIPELREIELTEIELTEEDPEI